MVETAVLILVGPTGSGKTSLSVDIASALGAEIISADSRQIFRYMDIVTAKPDRDQLSKIPHHFIDIVNPDQPYDAGQYGLDARDRVRVLHEEGKPVLVVGGSGLYIKALVDGFFESSSRDDHFRVELRKRIDEVGAKAIHDELRAVDPVTADRLHPNDVKRIERALEVYHLTGRPVSSLREEPSIPLPWTPVFVGLQWSREVLYSRIERRVDEMLIAGAVEETKKLLRMGYNPDLVSMEGLGYREIADYVAGRTTYERMTELFKQRTRNYAKRQLTWFRKDLRIKWFDMREEHGGLMAEKIVEYWKERRADTGPP